MLPGTKENCLAIAKPRLKVNIYDNIILDTFLTFTKVKNFFQGLFFSVVVGVC